MRHKKGNCEKDRVQRQISCGLNASTLGGVITKWKHKQGFLRKEGPRHKSRNINTTRTGIPDWVVNLSAELKPPPSQSHDCPPARIVDSTARRGPVESRTGATQADPPSPERADKVNPEPPSIKPSPGRDGVGTVRDWSSPEQLGGRRAGWSHEPGTSWLKPLMGRGRALPNFQSKRGTIKTGGRCDPNKAPSNDQMVTFMVLVWFVGRPDT